MKFGTIWIWLIDVHWSKSSSRITIYCWYWAEKTQSLTFKRCLHFWWSCDAQWQSTSLLRILTWIYVIKANIPAMNTGVWGTFVNVAYTVRASKATGTEAVVATEAVDTTPTILARIRGALIHVQLTPCAFVQSVNIINKSFSHAFIH